MADIDKLLEKVEAVETNRADQSIAATIFQIAPKLIAKQKAGATWAALCAALNEGGLEISEKTLALYIARYRRGQKHLGSTSEKQSKPQAALLPKKTGQKRKRKRGENPFADVKNPEDMPSKFYELQAQFSEEYRNLSLKDFLDCPVDNLPDREYNVKTWYRATQRIFNGKAKAAASLQKEESATSTEPSEEFATATE